MPLDATFLTMSSISPCASFFPFTTKVCKRSLDSLARAARPCRPVMFLIPPRASRVSNGLPAAVKAPLTTALAGTAPPSVAYVNGSKATSPTKPIALPAQPFIGKAVPNP